MAELVKYIFLFMIGTTILNLIIAIAARAKTHSKEFNQLILYWVALFMTFFATATLSRTPTEIAFAFFFQFIPSAVAIRIIRNSAGLRTNWNFYVGLQVVASALSAYLLLATDVGFTLSLVPVCGGLIYLFLSTTWGVLVTKKDDANWVEKAMAYVLITSAINIVNYALFRLDESAAWWGWSVSIAQYQCLSVFLPLLVNHRRQENERKGLETALEKLSGKNSYPQTVRIEELYEALELQISQKEEFSKRLEITNEELREEQEVNRILMKTISHDLANPLTVVSAYIDMIQSGRIPLEDHQKIHERMKLNISSAADMISRIRNAIVQRSQADLVTVTTVDVTFAIKRTLAMFDERLRKKGINVRLIQRTSDVTALADENALVEHVLANIVSNAIKFSFENQEIHIILSSSATGYSIEVRDFGTGINPGQEKGRSIFSTAGTKGETGTGFGLIIIAYFIRKFGGTLEIVPHAQQDQRGTSVIVNLGRPASDDMRTRHLPTEAANIFS